MFDIRRLLAGLAVVACLLAPTGSVRASRGSGGDAQAPPRRMIEARRAVGAIRVDGRLDEADWASAPSSGSWTQRYPDPGRPASFPTEVRVLYDEDALYVGVVCHDPEPGKIVRRMARRDREIPTDAVQIELDTQRNGREAYYFRLSESGTRIDAFIYNEFNLNYQWDAIWEAAAARFDGGWCAEFRIPFSELRFSNGEEVRFGFQVQRDVSRLQEVDQWQYNPPTSNRRVSAFGTLTGLKGVHPRRHLDLRPFVVGRARTHTREPFFGRGTDLDAGLDFRYPLGTNFTVTGTLNPDFGQVEADRIVLNLSTYETFYPEKRPFFVEGFQIFSPPALMGTTFLHTRRIGAPPGEPAPPAGGRVLSSPERTRILAAAKLTGTTADGLTVGGFAAVTEEVRARVQGADGAVADQMLQPQTLYGVLRLNQHLGKNSSVGLLTTAVDRKEGRDAVAGALTWDLNFRGNRDQIRGNVARSETRDAGVRTAGTGGDVEWVHKPTDRWRLRLGHVYYDPRFQLNDLGYLRRNDYRQTSFSANYTQDRPGLRFVQWEAGTNAWYTTNFAGAVLSRGLNVNAHGTLKNYWSVYAGVERGASAYDDRETRGGSLFQRPPALYSWWGFETDDRKAVRWEFWNDLNTTVHGRAWDAGFDLTWQASDRFSFVPALSYAESRGDFRWVDTVTDAAGSTHYLFADLGLREVNLSGRASYLFTSDMTADLYFQVFDAAGEYAGFQELLAAGLFQPFAYAGNPDFHELAFSVNLVYRWELRPGCTLYAVYGRGQAGGAPVPGPGRGTAMNPRGDWATLMNSPRDEVFLVKLIWRF